MNIRFFLKNLIKLILKKDLQNDLYLNLNKIHEALLSKTINKDEFIRVKKEIEDLMLKRENLNRIYEANKSLNIRNRIEKLNEKILKKQMMMEVCRIESLKLEAFNEFYEKFKIMDLKSNELKASLKDSDYERILTRVIQNASDEMFKLGTRDQRTKTDERIEAIREEVLKAIEKLESLKA
ncbi:MAG: hypothetical protein QXG01_04710 [Candidatus Bathyarchaeia archaeon]